MVVAWIPTKEYFSQTHLVKSSTEDKNYEAVAAFFCFLYAPTTIDLVSLSSVCEGLVGLASQMSSGTLRKDTAPASTHKYRQLNV